MWLWCGKQGMHGEFGPEISWKPLVGSPRKKWVINIKLCSIESESEVLEFNTYYHILFPSDIIHLSFRFILILSSTSEWLSKKIAHKVVWCICVPIICPILWNYAQSESYLKDCLPQTRMLRPAHCSKSIYRDSIDSVCNFAIGFLLFPYLSAYLFFLYFVCATCVLNNWRHLISPEF
jgi:hypothetical protein